LNRIAQRAGAQLWEANKVRGITEDVQGYVLHVGEGDRKRHVTTRFLIGADGALSVVRRVLFEQIKMKFQIAIRYCYRGSLNLNPDYLHYFALPDLPFLKSISRMMFFCWRLPQTLPNY
jgi:2-polyprenyl-6-methoxyphenol hydroxylase-like FAD-dependent oxidoreductase